MKLKFYTDPGHGWVSVKRELLKEYGISDQISSCSYQKGNTVYLEEDCDAPALVSKIAMKGIVVEYATSHTDCRSPIRSYESYKA